MKTNVTKQVTEEIEVEAIQMILPVFYDEDDIPNDYPHRDGEQWTITVDMDSGQIRDWPAGVEPREIYMKVTDSGIYQLLSGGKVLAKIHQDYVPHCCVPGSWGDYVKFNIDENGLITNWPKKPTFDSFFLKQRS